MQKQISKAKRHSEFADAVRMRREEEKAHKDMYLNGRDDNIERMRALNQQRRDENRAKIDNHKQ